MLPLIVSALQKTERNFIDPSGSFPLGNSARKHLKTTYTAHFLGFGLANGTNYKDSTLARVLTTSLKFVT